MSTTTERGSALEDEVARLYELLGGKASRRLYVAGYEVDVAVELHFGPLALHLLVECKHFSGAKVSDNDMRSFVVKLLSARQAGLADKGVFVTTSGYTKTAIQTAANHGIQCLTLTELQNQLVDFTGYVDSALAEYSNSDLAKWYVPQKGSDLEDYGAIISDTDAAQYIYSPLVEYVATSFNEVDRIVLLGDFGTGKSTFVTALTNWLLTEYRKGETSRLPIPIPLSDYRPGVDIEQLALSILRRGYGIDINAKVLGELERMDRFIFLLDGLDEMATRVDRSVLAENLREIERLHEYGQKKWLLTSRTHFFHDRISDVFTDDYRILYLVDWGLDELEDYLRKRLGAVWQRVYENVLQSRRIRELVRTPQFVDMLLTGIGKNLETDQVHDLTSIDLYEKYIEKWVRRESTRRGAVMDAGQRERFVEFLATRLYLEERTEIHFSELYEIGREFSGYGDPSRLDYFDSDVRTCTFITRTRGGNYGFKHKSFMEYICAKLIVREIENRTPSLLTVRMIPSEVGDFVSELAIGTNGRQYLFESAYTAPPSGPERILFKNALQIIGQRDWPLPKRLQQRLERPADDKWTVLRDALLKGDDDDFARAFKAVEFHLFALVRHLAVNQVADYQGPDEVVQEVLLQLWRSASRRPEDLGNIRDFRSYIVAIMFRILRDREKRSARSPDLLPIESLNLSSAPFQSVTQLTQAAEADPSRRVAHRELREAFAKAALAKAEHEAIGLMLLGENYGEIAATLGISRDTARTLIHQARRKIQAVLAGEI